MKGRRRFLVVAICGATLVWANWLGPVVSGAILLLAPAPGKPQDHDLPRGYVPLQGGSRFRHRALHA